MPLKRNYQKELDNKINSLTNKPELLLHCCCAPCSSYTLEYLNRYFRISVFFYNPNITNPEEYEKRILEEKRFLSEYPFPEPIAWIPADYRPEDFFDAVKGMEQIPEGGKRCERCYGLRLRETAKTAAAQGFPMFCTTLSVSPHKNADILMKTGENLAREYEIEYLPSDFKKRDGYRKSIQLSNQYHLYRQNFCGCEFSGHP